MAEITLALAFLAGLVSFLSPCVLPLVPAYLTFMAGSSSEELGKNPEKARRKIFLNSLAFVLGFSLIFSVLGVLLQSVLSSIAYDAQAILGYVGGSLIIFFGLVMTGVVNIPALQREYKLKVNLPQGSYWTSALFGAAFAVGWTPCVGAVLGGVLTLAATQPEVALPLMLSYSLGLGLPFLLAGAFISRASGVITRISPYLHTLNVFFGVVLIILGILVFTRTLNLIANLGFVNDMLLK